MCLLGLLGEVASAACQAADDSEGLAGGDAIVPADRFQALSDALDECDKLPELDDNYVRDGWLRALDTLRSMLKLPKTDACVPAPDETTMFRDVQLRPCSECGDRGCNGECSGDGQMGD